MASVIIIIIIIIGTFEMRNLRYDTEVKTYELFIYKDVDYIINSFCKDVKNITTPRLGHYLHL